MAKTHWAELPTTLQEIEEAQQADPVCEELRREDPRASPGRIHYQDQQGVLYRGVPSKYTGFNYQLVVPVKMVEEFLAYFHNSPFGGHLGRMKTLLRILEVAWWPSIRRDVWDHVRSCRKCQQYKATNERPAGQLQQTNVQTPGEMIGVDFMGPLPLSKARNTMLMVVVDYYTKWVELFPMKDANTPRLCKILKDEVLKGYSAIFGNTLIFHFTLISME